jgi:transaldolase
MGKSSEEISLHLALEDISRTADLFRPVYERTNTVDGWVSLEVSPLLAYDTEGTLRAAKDLYARTIEWKTKSLRGRTHDCHG